MKAEIVSNVLVILLLVVGISARAQDCPVEVGDTAQYVDTETIYNEFMSYNLLKSEYETISEYENRIEELMARHEVNRPRLFRATYSPEHITYIAEKGEFIVKTYAWDNLGFDWTEVFGGYGIYNGEQLNKNPWGIDVRSAGDLVYVHGMALTSNEAITGSYMASNAAGLSFEVIEVERNEYAVFDEIMDPYREKKWNCELYSGEYNTCSATLSVPREQARALKEGLSVGIVATPKAPLAATGTKRETPTVVHRRDVTYNRRAIIADMHCAVLSGPDGKIVKTVNSVR